MKTAREVAVLGLSLAAASALSFFESALCGMMALPPGVRLGLSNIAVLMVMLLLGHGRAVTLAVLKAGFVLLVRGFVAGILSLAGGICSVLVMLALLSVRRTEVSRRMLCMAGAVSHNIAQILAAMTVMGSSYLFYYMPVLLVSGVAAGWMTGSIYRAAEPYFIASKLKVWKQ